MHARSSNGRLARLAALIGIGLSLIVIAGCGGSSTVVGVRATATAPHAAVTATATTLPDPKQSPTTVVVAPTPQGDPTQCAPASTVAPLPATLTTLYAAGSDGTVTALNVSGGSKRWSYATGVSSLFTPILGGGLVYLAFGQQAVGAPTTILALGAADGTVKWQAQLPGDSHYGGGVPIQVVDGVVYAPGADGILRALDGATGAEHWRYQVGGGIATVMVAGGMVYAQSSFNGGLVALRASDGGMLWRFATDANTIMAPVVANGLVYVAQTATTLVALNATTGAVHWRDDFPDQYPPSPFPVALRGAVAAGTGLYVNGFSALFAANGSTGALCWITRQCGQGGTSIPLLDGNAVYETCFGGSPGPGSVVACGAFAVDAHTGAQRWSDGFRGCAEVTPASLVNNLLYVQGTQAQALRPDTGAAAWRYPAQESLAVQVGVVVIAGVAYTNLGDGTVHALGALDGAPRWSTTVAANGTSFSMVAGA